MKKVLLFCFIAFSGITAYSQHHLSFSGTTMGMNLSAFIKQLENKGYTLYDFNDRDAFLLGTFAGNEVLLNVMSTPIQHQVYCVTVMYSEMDSWIMLNNLYNCLKSQLQCKYGKPTDVIETFGSGYSEKNAYWALMAEKCTYSTIFSVSGGQIMVSIISPYMLPFGNLPRVILMYEDKINKRLSESERINDL